MTLPAPTWRWRAGSVSQADNTLVASLPGTGTVTTALTQANSAVQPRLRTGANGIGGQSALQYTTAVEEVLSGTIGVTAQATWMVVHQRVTMTGPSELFWTDGQEIYVNNDNNERGLYVPYTALPTTTPALPTTPQVWTGVFSGTSGTSTYRENGTVRASGLLPNSVPGNKLFYLGAWNQPSRPYAGKIAEIIGWNRALTGPELADAHSYVQDTYGITVADYVAPPLSTQKTPADTLPISDTVVASLTSQGSTGLGGYTGGYGGGYTAGGSGAFLTSTQTDLAGLTDSISVARTSVGSKSISDPLPLTDSLSALRVVATIPVDAPSPMRLRLVAYTVGGAKLGDVPFGLGITRFTQMGEIPNLEAEYSLLQRNVGFIDDPCEVAFQYSDANGNWIEPINARFISDSDNYDRLDNGQLVHRFGFIGYLQMLRFVNVVGGLSTDLGLLDAEGKRVFKNMTPGAVMLLIINDAKARGYLPHITAGFTATATSDGQPWAKVLTRDWPGETDALTILQDLREGGWVDFWSDGRTFHMSNPDTVLARELSTGTSPVYIRDQTLTASPEEVKYSDMITKVMVIGENGFRMLRENPAAVKPFGERVVTLSVGGVEDEATASIQAEALLRKGQSPSRSLSREYTVTETTKFVPERDFRTGDWIKADTSAQLGERMRAFATSVREEGGEVKAFVTLGTVHDDLLLRLAKRQAGMAGGSGVNSGGTPAPVIPDQAVPKAPTGLVVDSDAYNDSAGYAQAIISATWVGVTEATGGGGVDVTGYELWYRENVAGAKSRMLRETQDTTVTYSPLPTGKPFAFKVRAYTGSKWSAFTPEVVITTPTDAEPPPRPSLPTTTSTLGVITVAWDGKTETATAMPFDFDHVEVYQQQGAASILIDSLSLKGFTSIGGLTAGQTYNFALRAVDKTGNASPLTAWVPQQVVSVVYTTQISDAGITAPKIATNAVTADAIMAGSIDGMLITAPIIRTAGTGQRSQFDTQGLRLWNSANVLKMWANPANGQVRIYSTTDASPTSTGHGIQFGDDNGSNLIIDDNEVMSRFNGNISDLALNRQGGPLFIGGGWTGQFSDPDNIARTYPATGNHAISLRGRVTVSNTEDADYADESPPFMIGAAGGFHLSMDTNEIMAAAGDFADTLSLQPNYQNGTPHGARLRISNAVDIRRLSTNPDTPNVWIGGADPAASSPNCGLQLFDGEVLARNKAVTAYVPLVASSHLVRSSITTKQQISDFDPIPMIKGIRAKRWRYRDQNRPDWHFGPMAEDLPAELQVTISESPGTTVQGTDLGALIGVLWEMNRVLLDRVETTDARTTALTTRVVALERRLGITINLPL